MRLWNVYILVCADGSLYTGITNNLEKRVVTHNSGKGAKYTRGRLPVEVGYSEKSQDRSTAQVREHELKQLSHADKLQLITR